MGGGGKGGESSKVKYTQSPEQRAIYGRILPLINKLSDAGQYGVRAWNTPTAPTFSAADNNLLPTADWYNSLSPEVMAGINAPYDESRNQLMEQFGGAGEIGSPSAGYSGAAGAALGKFEAERAKNVGLQAWQMTQPGLQWQAGANQNAQMMNWANTAESYKFPFTALPGLLGGTYPTPIVNQSPSMANNLGAGIMGGLGGYGFGQQYGMNPWYSAGAGALGSYMGGK